jgi:hypothetical protein
MHCDNILFQRSEVHYTGFFIFFILDQSDTSNFTSSQGGQVDESAPTTVHESASSAAVCAQAAKRATTKRKSSELISYLEKRQREFTEAEEKREDRFLRQLEHIQESSTQSFMRGLQSIFSPILQTSYQLPSNTYQPPFFPPTFPFPAATPPHTTSPFPLNLNQTPPTSFSPLANTLTTPTTPSQTATSNTFTQLLNSSFNIPDDF